VPETRDPEGGADAAIPEAVHWAVVSFAVDRVTAEVTRALSAASIESILFKGPTIATWLYRNDRPRIYWDSDLLVPRRDWEQAMQVVKKLGFEDSYGPLAHPRMESGAGYPWQRAADGANVDLHYTWFAVGADPEELWEALAEDGEQQSVGGVEVRVPSHPARLLHIVLHAVQHGGERLRKPMMDLEQAVSMVSPSVWERARDLAVRLDVLETFATGLALTPEGEKLGAAIDARAGSSVGTVLRLKGVPLSEGFEELSQKRGIRAKLALIGREIFPNRAFMRWWTPLAWRGAIGLTAAYLWRVLWLAYRAVPGFVAWRRTNRRIRRAG
jgi:hypothetical protein